MSSAHKKSKKNISSKNGFSNNSSINKRNNYGGDETRSQYRYRSLSATGTRAMQKRHNIVR